MSEWIGVKDRLPEIHQEVLFYSLNYKSIEKGYCFHIGDDNKNDILFTNDEVMFELKDATYWMPLPEPPKLEESK